MPEINPLTNNQIFLKKIAENTGSDYDTGDVSEINPLTIDQIFLKEIAANTAGQSGDITELEGKVADNASAIRALSDTMAANGIYNLLPHPYEDSTKTIGTITYTVNNDWSLTIEGNAQSQIADFSLFSGIVSDIFPKVGRYKISFGKSIFPVGLTFRITINGTTTQAGSYPYELDVTSEMLSQTLVMTIRLWGEFGISPAFTVYPVVYPDGTMTNRELTENSVKIVDVLIDTLTLTAGETANLNISSSVPSGYIPTSVSYISDNNYGLCYSMFTEFLYDSWFLLLQNTTNSSITLKGHAKISLLKYLF